MTYGWLSKSQEYAQMLDEEISRLQEKKRQKTLGLIPSVATTPAPETPWMPQEQPTYEVPMELPELPVPTTPMPWMQVPTTPIEQLPDEVTSTTPAVEKPSKELDVLHPFKIEDDLPLWAKTLNFVGKPFELIQEYLFDPLLATAHLPWTKELTGTDLERARQEGIMSFFPGGVRHQAYEELQYAGKWAVEMLPWLIVLPIGTVGLAGAGGRGIAGALSKLGKVGQLAGRTLEYSPAGLAEKGIGAVIGKVTGRPPIKTVVPQVEQDPVISLVTTLIKKAKTKLPEQAGMTHELRLQQLNKAMPELEKGSGESALRNFMNALKGEGEKVDFESFANELSQKERDSLADMIRKSSRLVGFDFAQASKGWQKILEGHLPYDSELEQLEKVFGSDMVKALMEKRPGNIITKISDVANAPRAILASVDLSGLLRQGAILTARHPLESMKTVKPMVKAFYSDKNAELVVDAINSRAHTNLAIENGIYLAPLPSRNAATTLSKMEESFMSKWVENIPILGSAVRASNRAYVTGLNDLRSRVWESTVSSWEKLGLSPVQNDYKQLATLINAASGRGSLHKSLQGASPLFNAMLFSPRLFFSRLQFPAMIASSSPLVRKEAARQLVSFLGAGTAILGMAKVAGAGIEIDPRSADFGKIKIGNTRLDIWSGYAQWARFMAQLTTEQRKTAGGNITETNRQEVVTRFMQSKFSPAMGLLNDLLRGESYSGEKMGAGVTDVQRQAWTRFAPLFIQDMIDAIDQDGMIGGVVASPGLFGIGVVTYMSPANKMREQLAQETYGKTWEQVGSDPELGIAKQQELQRSNPKLLAQVQLEKDEYNKTIQGKSDIGNIYRNQTSTIEDQYKSNVDLASQEYRTTKDGYAFKEKILKLADNRRSQYDILNKDPQFATIVARYNELPTAADLQKMSPQDWARKEYMRMMYSPDMYDQYGNYRFDMTDDMRQLFASTYGQNMLDYIETYQGIKEQEMSPEYKLFKQAQKVLRPYWGVLDDVQSIYGEPTTVYQQRRQDRIVESLRKRMRLQDKQLNDYYNLFYRRVV